eukprot:CAMPEP_0202495904 /NCGR_PEP_ID=MMETSP1361-20130828/18234_1 /ASSEMBLY_ACC=CAM_ASM_000849 /TAXON_ID=210615 /ORGANISM="Staurosira complex sp., Strain CCMP2646" /LENGTH=68 /DNA_ID=CAMNT_0049127083 /DNA_START=265 /DNA_END=468 /DNA_ORIENTATION=-
MTTTSNTATTRKAPSRTAAVLGATGNCGIALVKELAASPEWSSIKVVSRRSLKEYNDMPKVQEEIVRM